jgi:hypothetical protein
MTTYFTTREEWLGVAAQELAAHFESKGFTLPAKLRFSCSWPAGSRGSKKVLGQCVAPEASQDGSTEVYIVPTVADPKLALGVLVHELVHAAVGVRHGHKRPFAVACDKLGLTGKPAQALPGPQMIWEMERVLAAVGDYPHAAVNLDARKKQSTRMLKAVCPETGYTVRLTKKHADTGMPVSPAGADIALATLTRLEQELSGTSFADDARKALDALAAHRMELDNNEGGEE